MITFEDRLFLHKFVNDTELLFYGELESLFPIKLKEVLICIKNKIQYAMHDTDISYWFIITILDKLNFTDYGTSPRCAWLTDDGERLLTLVDYLLDYDFMVNIQDDEIFDIYDVLIDQMTKEEAIIEVEEIIKTRSRK